MRLAVISTGLLGATAFAAPLKAQFGVRQDPRLTSVAQAVEQVLESPATPFVEFLGTPRQFAPGRWFTIASRSRAESGAPVSVYACVADSAVTYTARCIVVPTPRLDYSLFAADTPQDRSESDLDGDSVPELRFSLTYSTRSEPAVGPDLFTRHYVFRAAPAPRMVLEIVVAHDPGASGLPHRSGSIHVQDADGDGVPDLIVRGTQCAREPDGSGEGCRDYEWTWLWRRATRTWVRSAVPVRTRTAPSS